MKIILYAIPGFVVLILTEWIYGLVKGCNTYRTADTITSITLGSISRLRGLLFLGLGSWFYVQATDGFHLLDLPNEGIGVWVFALVAYDFSYYWFHRISHEVNLFWAAHVVHHQSEDYNLGTALRQTSSGFFGFVFFVPWLYVGIPVDIFVASAAINLVYQFWVHTEHIPKLGPVEWVFVTASNHRVHHAQNKIYIDRNYGGIFIIWDRLFGSFQEELGEEPCIYGIRKPLQSHNPLWANCHVYWSALVDSWRAKRWQDKLRIWFRGPGWRPPELHQKYPVASSDLAHFKKFHPSLPRVVLVYAFLQFLATLLAATTLLVVANSWIYRDIALAVSPIVFSFYLQSAWTEGKRHAMGLEWAKLVSVFAVTNFLPLGAISTVLVWLYLATSVLYLVFLMLTQSGAAQRSEITTTGPPTEGNL